MIVHQKCLRQPNSQIMGGKGANLLYLSQKKYPVPEFFILTSSFLNSASKNKSIRGINFSKDLSKKIYHSFDQLNSSTVSVRSSINVEDGQNHSFAGIFESFLNVKKKNLMSTINKCWASTFSKRAQQYCDFHQIEFKTLKPAIIIQKMIKADKGGVVFSKDQNDQILIEACLGNGEQVVNGVADISQYTASRQDKKINKTNGVLNQDEIYKLISTSLKIEKEFNHPQDIEWAMEKNQLYILQSRPITVY